MRRMNLALLAIMALAGVSHAWLDLADPDVVIRTPTDDNRFSFYAGPSNQAEWLLNYGASSTVRIKGHDDPSAFKWDISDLKGLTILEAEIHLCKSNTDPINALVASTINTDWTEGVGTGYAASSSPCWRWRRYVNVEWTYPGSDFSTAAFGNFGTLVCFGYKVSDTFKTYTSEIGRAHV